MAASQSTKVQFPKFSRNLPHVMVKKSDYIFPICDYLNLRIEASTKRLLHITLI